MLDYKQHTHSLTQQNRFYIEKIVMTRTNPKTDITSKKIQCCELEVGTNNIFKLALILKLSPRESSSY